MLYSETLTMQVALENLGFQVDVVSSNTKGKKLIGYLRLGVGHSVEVISFTMDAFEPGLFFTLSKPIAYKRFNQKLESALTLKFKYATTIRGGKLAISETNKKLDEYMKKVSFTDLQTLNPEQLRKQWVLPFFFTGVPAEFLATVWREKIPVYNSVVMAVADGLIIAEEAPDYWKIPIEYQEKLLYPKR